MRISETGQRSVHGKAHSENVMKKYNLETVFAASLTDSWFPSLRIHHRHQFV